MPTATTPADSASPTRTTKVSIAALALYFSSRDVGRNSAEHGRLRATALAGWTNHLAPASDGTRAAFTKSVRVLSEMDVLDAELQRREADVDRIRRRLAELRGEPPPMLRPAASTRWAEIEGDSIAPLAEIERRYVLHVLARLGGHRKRAARVLGIGNNTLWRKLKLWGVPPGRPML